MSRLNFLTYTKNSECAFSSIWVCSGLVFDRTIHPSGVGGERDTHLRVRIFICPEIICIHIFIYIMHIIRYYFKRSRGGRRRKRRGGSQGSYSYSGSSAGSSLSYHSQSASLSQEGMASSSPLRKKPKFDSRPSSQEGMGSSSPLRKKPKVDSRPSSQENPHAESELEASSAGASQEGKTKKDKGKEKIKEDDENNDEGGDQDHEDEEEEVNWTKKKVPSSSLSSSSITTVASEFLDSCKIYLHIVGQDYLTLKKAIQKYVFYNCDIQLI